MAFLNWLGLVAFGSIIAAFVVAILLLIAGAGIDLLKHERE